MQPRAFIFTLALAIAAAFALPSAAHAATILGWEIDSTINANDDATITTSYGNGVTATGLNASILSEQNLSATNQSDRWRWSGWGNDSTALADIATTNYIEFTVSPQAGYQFSLDATDSIQFGTRPSFAEGDSVVIRSSLDSFSANLDTFGPFGTGSSVVAGFDLGTGFQNLSSDVTFRIYAYDPTDVTGNQSIGQTSVAGDIDFAANGTVTLIPEPSTALLLASSLGLVIFGSRRRARA